jgi:hypothetical protein
VIKDFCVEETSSKRMLSCQIHGRLKDHILDPAQLSTGYTYNPPVRRLFTRLMSVLPTNLKAMRMLQANIP